VRASGNIDPKPEKSHYIPCLDPKPEMSHYIPCLIADMLIYIMDLTYFFLKYNIQLY
jgi:hypothetical protein